MRKVRLADSGIRETITESRDAHDFSVLSKVSVAEHSVRRRRVWQFT